MPVAWWYIGLPIAAMLLCLTSPPRNPTAPQRSPLTHSRHFFIFPLSLTFPLHSLLADVQKRVFTSWKTDKAAPKGCRLQARDDLPSPSCQPVTQLGMFFWRCGDRMEIRHRGATAILQTVGQALAVCSWEAHASTHGGIWELTDTMQAQQEGASGLQPSQHPPGQHCPIPFPALLANFLSVFGRGAKGLDHHYLAQRHCLLTLSQAQISLHHAVGVAWKAQELCAMSMSYYLTSSGPPVPALLWFSPPPTLACKGLPLPKTRGLWEKPTHSF